MRAKLTTSLPLTQEGHEPEVTRDADLLRCLLPEAIVTPPEVILEHGLVNHGPEDRGKVAG